MSDTNTNTNTAPKADAPRAAEKAADAAPKAAAQAAPAAAKPLAAATAKAAVAPVKAAARTATKTSAKRSAKAAKRTTRSASAKRTTRTAKAAPAKRRTAAQKAAPKKAAVTRSLNTATATNLNAINQGTTTMKNEAKQAADRIQAVFGDVNERARTAMERNSRIADEMTELTKGNVEALVASTKIAAKAVETIGQDVAEFSRKSFDDASAALKGFAEIKSPADFFRLQGDFARSQFDTMVAETSKLSETMIKFAGQAAEPISGRYSVAAERVRNVVVAV